MRRRTFLPSRIRSSAGKSLKDLDDHEMLAALLAEKAAAFRHPEVVAADRGGHLVLASACSPVGGLEHDARFSWLFACALDVLSENLAAGAVAVTAVRAGIRFFLRSCPRHDRKTNMHMLCWMVLLPHSGRLISVPGAVIGPDPGRVEQLVSALSVRWRDRMAYLAGCLSKLEYAVVDQMLCITWWRPETLPGGRYCRALLLGYLGRVGGVTVGQDAVSSICRLGEMLPAPPGRPRCCCRPAAAREWRPLVHTRQDKRWGPLQLRGTSTSPRQP